MVLELFEDNRVLKYNVILVNGLIHFLADVR